jgi:hypothetical protein
MAVEPPIVRPERPQQRNSPEQGFPRLLGPMSGRELVLAWGSLTLVGVLIFAPHIMHGGFYLDDWALIAATQYPPQGPGFANALSFFNELLSSCRPVLILFFPLKYVLLGTHTKYILALAVTLAVMVAALAYGVLRILNLPWYHAWLLAGLTLAYPWFDSTRLWDSASPISLAVIFAFAGIWLALIGLSRRSWRLHGCAAALYLLSMLTYEITLPLIAAMGILYTLRAGWKQARYRWGVDLLMVLAAGLWSRLHTPREISTLSGNIEHLGEITTQGGELLGRSLIPLGLQPHTTLALLVLMTIFVVGVVAYRAFPSLRGNQQGWGLLNWLRLAAAGLLIAALGWVMFVPADPYYTPSIFGFTNRVNGMAGFGLIMVVYASLGIIGSLIGSLLPKRSVVTLAVTLSLGLALGAAYIHVLERHGRLWDAAYRTENQMTAKIQSTFPRLPHGTTLFASNYPAYQTLGVPIFAVSWDLNGRIKLLYEDSSLRAFPVTTELGYFCEDGGIQPGDAGAAGETLEMARYGTARLLDLQTGEWSVPRNRRQCLADQDRFVPGPLYLSTSY